MKSIFLGAVCFLTAGSALAHEGHSVPGALPAGSHGGKIVEARVTSGTPTNHDELFFEVVYKDNRVSLYPKVLQANNESEFKDISPKELGTIELVGENGRTKQTTPLKAEIGDAQVDSTFELKGTKFGFVSITVNHAGAKKLAKAQVGKH